MPFRSNPNPDEPAAERVVVNDKRRIDPTTGALRDNNPFASLKDPADPANASQPLTVTDDSELAAAQQSAAERLADLQRITAEYANYRKRVDRDRAQVVANAKALVLTELLPVLDDLDRADRHGDLTGPFKAVADRLTGILHRVGLTQFGADGDVFDPSVHEAVQFSISPEVSEQVVGTVMRHGYTLGDRLVRAAIVGVVGPGSEEDAVTDSSTTDPAGLGVAADPADGTASFGPPSTSETIPEHDWATGAATGDSGGAGGFGPDGRPL